MTRDYYPVLRRATSALVPNTDEARRAVYDRARHAITHSGLSPAEIGNEHSALQAAIERLEAETQQATGRRRRQSPMPPVAREGTPAKAARTPGSARKAVSGRMIAALATPVLLIGVALYALWPRAVTERGSASKRTEAVVEHVDDAKPDSGSSDPKRSYIFNRQMVYYRTIHPVGTIVIAKSQRFLYLVRSNVSALRYTTGVGRECANAAGLLVISAKEQWPQQPPQPAPNAQQPNRRFGARSLTLGDTGHRIHGTYEPTTAGEDGCFPLVNDDIIDLYDRIPVGTRAVIN